MTTRVVMRWNLRQVMASRGMFATTELVPLLAQRGVTLSREHVYRLVTKTPQRLNIEVLAALCDLLDCEPNDLLQPVVESVQAAWTGTEPTSQGIGDLRPVRARIRRPPEGQ